MFRRKLKGKKLVEALSMIKPTSKASLKQACLFLSNLDIDKASAMYDFLIKDMEELPAVEPASRSFIQNFGEQASGVLGWFRENQDVLSQGVDMIRGILARRKGGAAPAASPLPPINE